MIRFYNGKLLRLKGGVSLTEDEVWVEGSRICYVGPKKAEMPEFEREIDLDGDVLMPGFKNAHTHTAMTFLRSYADDMPLNDWLYKQVFPMEAKLLGKAGLVSADLALDGGDTGVHRGIHVVGKFACTVEHAVCVDGNLCKETAALKAESNISLGFVLEKPVKLADLLYSIGTQFLGGIHSFLGKSELHS